MLSEPMPSSVRDLRKAEEAAVSTYSTITTHLCPIPPPTTIEGLAKVECPQPKLLIFDLWRLVDELMADPVHAQYCQWRYKAAYRPKPRIVQQPFIGPRQHEQYYSEVWTGKRWREIEVELYGSGGGPILFLIFSADGTPVSMSGRSVHSVYVTLGNLYRCFRQKAAGRKLVGFIPTIRPTKAYTNDTSIREYRRKVKRWAWEEILRPVKAAAQTGGRDFKNVAKDPMYPPVLKAFPVLGFASVDEVELHHAITNTMSGSKTFLSCTVCSMHRVNDGLMCHDAPLRDPDAVRELMMTAGGAKTQLPKFWALQRSLHPEYNDLFFLQGFNPFMNPSDRMHQLDNGIFVMILQDIVKLLGKKELGGSKKLVEEFDVRWAYLGHFPGMKIFNRGVSTLAMVTATERKMMAMGLPFVVRGLQNKMTTTINISLEDIAMAYVKWRYLVNDDEPSVSDVNEISSLGIVLQHRINALRLLVDKKDVEQGQKFHKIVHWPLMISSWGCSSGFDTCWGESEHRFTVKRWSRSGAISFVAQNAERKMMKADQIRDLHKCGPVSKVPIDGNPANSTEIISSSSNIYSLDLI